MLNPNFRDMLLIFSEEQVNYMVVGAYALAAHGLPRATGDIDLWIQCSQENANRVWRSLIRFGVSLLDLKKEDLVTSGIVFQIGVAPRRIDILTAIDGVEFEEAIKVPVIGKKHLIENKRAAGRPKDQADLAWLENIENQ
ncbi:MAG: hypothetical protein AB1489_17320 [Acidobacteriota bacterium]